MKVIILTSIISCLGLTACVNQLGGDGQLSNGEPISAVMDVQVGGTTIFDIASPDGWSCRSVMTEPLEGARKTLPVVCSDGTQGKMIVTMDALQSNIHGAFSLTNGRSGKVSFALKRR